MIHDQHFEEKTLVVYDINYFSIQQPESSIVPINQNQYLDQIMESYNVSKYQVF